MLDLDRDYNIKSKRYEKNGLSVVVRMSSVGTSISYIRRHI